MTAVKLNKFQFPSNGKAHANTYMNSHCRISIDGFNSLQTGRHMRTTVKVTVVDQQPGFNSLQTGRNIRTNADETHFSAKEFSFNSLQTGRNIRTGIS